MDAIGLHKKDEVDLAEILRDFAKLSNYHEAGAVACFVGVVREDPVHEFGGKVVSLQYEAYADVALRKMQEIRELIKKRPGIIDVSIHHVIDVVTVGEPSLFVAVLGKHRQDVFPAISETVERIKREVPIWKKEFTTKESYWVASETEEGSSHSH